MHQRSKCTTNIFASQSNVFFHFNRIVRMPLFFVSFPPGRVQAKRRTEWLPICSSFWLCVNAFFCERRPLDRTSRPTHQNPFLETHAIGTAQATNLQRHAHAPLVHDDAPRLVRKKGATWMVRVCRTSPVLGRVWLGDGCLLFRWGSVQPSGQRKVEESCWSEFAGERPSRASMDLARVHGLLGHNFAETLGPAELRDCSPQERTTGEPRPLGKGWVFFCGNGAARGGRQS